MIDERVAAIGEDNSIVLYESGKVITTIYPPPSAHDLKDVFFLESSKRVLVLLDSGVICLFSIEGETGLLERMIRTGDITDVESRQLTFPIQCIKLVNCIPPQYDCELVLRKNSSNQPVDSKFVAMSAGKGTIMFMTVNKIDKIYSRFSIHRETIINIEELPGFIITMCAARILQISKFSEGQLVKYKKLELKAQISFLRALDPDKIFLSFQSGHSEIVQIKNERLYLLINKDIESDGFVTCVDIVPDNQIFATAASNNMIYV